MKSLKGHWGFPKGKRNRGETVEDNALRELFEETGLTGGQITLHAGLHADEYSGRRGLAVRYLAATLAVDVAPLILPAGELVDARWWRVVDAMAVLKKPRRGVLETLVAALGA